MSFAEINGANLYYEVKGEGEPILMVHGYPLDSRMWDAQFEELAKNYQAIRFDMAGFHQSSPHDNDFSLLDDMKGLLEHLSIEKVHLMGLSVGGNISMDFATTFPEMVDKLILASTSLMGWMDISSEKKRYLEELKECKGLEETINLISKSWLAGPFRAISEMNQELVIQYTNMLRTNLSKENGKGKMILPEKKTIELVGTIAAPTLIVTPDLDFPDVLWIAEYLDKNITNSSMIVLPDTAHLLTMEKPAEFNRIVMEFLGR